MSDLWSQYSEKVIEHFRNPRKVGDMENPDGVGRAGSPVCGDTMELYIKVKDGIIVDAKFKTFGCGAAIASGSMATEMMKGKTVQEVLSVTNKAVAEAIGDLPPAKVHCSVLAEDAIRSAVKDYLDKAGKKGSSRDE